MNALADVQSQQHDEGVVQVSWEDFDNFRRREIQPTVLEKPFHINTSVHKATTPSHSTVLPTI